MSIRVNLFLDNNLARVKPQGFLGEDLWPVFIKAIEGAKYVRERKANLATLDKVPNILVKLRESGFDAHMSKELCIALQERTAQMWNDDQAVKERIELIDEEIYKQSGDRLFPYQKVGARWLSSRYSALLADEMGVGKTLQVLVALPANVPAIIVVPASIKGNWVCEFQKFRPQLQPKILQGRNSFKWPKEGEILITNYDILPEIHDTKGEYGRECHGYLAPEKCLGCKDELIFTPAGVTTQKNGHLPNCSGFKESVRCYGCHPILKEVVPQTVLAFDEAQKIKSGTAKMAIRARALARAVREANGRTWAITGTPMENDPKELWYVMDAAGIAELCFGTWKNFVQLFKGKILEHNNYKWGIPETEEVVENIRRGSLRRLRSEVLPDLPSKRWQEIIVDVDKKTLKQCDEILEEFGGINKLTELLEKETIPFERMSAVRAALATAKIPALLEILEEFQDYPDPIIVFSMHRAPIETVGKLRGWEIIDGTISTTKRMEIVKNFQEGKYKGLGCTIQTSGVGFTLHRANRAIFVDQSFKPTQNAQAEDRMVRIGQKKGTIFTILKANHILDQRVNEILLRKRKLIVASVDAASIASDNNKINSNFDEFKEYFEKIQEEINNKINIRREAVTEEEKEALESAHFLVFLNKQVEKLMLELLEQASMIGLSPAQWALLVRVRQEGKVPEEISQKFLDVEEDRKNVIKIDDFLDRGVVEEGIKMSEKTKINENLEIIRSLKKGQREILFEFMREFADFNKSSYEKTFKFFNNLEQMNEDESDELYEKIGLEFCTSCGDKGGTDHECEFEDEEEEEDEDE